MAKKTSASAAGAEAHMGSDVTVNARTDIEALPYWQNQEMSWLSYAQRILDLAADDTVPLLGRLSFMSTFQSDVHQFFQQRVGSLEERICSLAQKKDAKSKRHVEKLRTLSQAIYAKAGSFSEQADACYTKTTNLLRSWGIDHVHGARLRHTMPEYQRLYLVGFIKENVIEYLAPFVVDADTPFPYLEDNTVYVIAELKPKGNKKGDPKLGIVALPDRFNRLIELPCGEGKNVLPTRRIASSRMDVDCGDTFSFVLLEDALELLLEDVFTHYEVGNTDSVAIYRNADIRRFKEIDPEDNDYLEEVVDELSDRRHERPILLLVRNGFSGHAAKLLRKGLGLRDYQIQTSGLPLAFSFEDVLKSHLNETALTRLAWKPYSPKWIRTGSNRLNPNRSILDQVSDHDVLLSFPYESMEPFLQMLKEAATDPSVSAIDITIFRLAKDSQVAAALMEAARNGKKVTAVVELRAGFGEGENAEWAKRLHAAGVKVIYGLPKYKVHGKICCITRTQYGALERIVQIGTGNYDEVTAAEYTDFSFMTADDQIGRDAKALFYNIEKERVSSEYRSLVVAPTQIRHMILRKIDKQIELQKEGYPSGVFFKVDAVTDKEIIEKLVCASQVGVPIVMIVRDSVCVLPGIEGYTEHIRVASLVGRLLEHSRIYGFGTWDDMDIYLASADLMKRNMDERIEIAWPILDHTLKTRIIQYINLCLNDTSKLRELLPDGEYTQLGALAKLSGNDTAEPFDSQEYLLRRG